MWLTKKKKKMFNVRKKLGIFVLLPYKNPCIFRSWLLDFFWVSTREKIVKSRLPNFDNAWSDSAYSLIPWRLQMSLKIKIDKKKVSEVFSGVILYSIEHFQSIFFSFFHSLSTLSISFASTWIFSTHRAMQAKMFSTNMQVGKYVWTKGLYILLHFQKITALK